MNLVDVNVLIYACTRESERHEEYRGWLARALGGSEPLGCTSQSLASLVRVLTHPRVWRRPITIDDALTLARAVRSAPAIVFLEPGERHWEIFAALCRDADARGNLVMDAWLAALAIEHGCTVITTDRDFARFPGLSWRHPLKEGSRRRV